MTQGGSPFHIFRWREEEGFGNKRILRPTLYVNLAIGDLDTTTKALVDTGSPRCVFPRGVGEALGLEFPMPSQAARKVLLMSHTWPVITETVTFDLEPFDDLAWEGEVDFVLEEGLPFGILGYEGFFNRWAVSFNAYEGYFVVEPVDDFAERLPLDPFDEMTSRYPDPYEP